MNNFPDSSVIEVSEGRVVVDPRLKQEVFYHITPTDNVPGILQQGLKPPKRGPRKGRTYLALYRDDLRELVGEMKTRGYRTPGSFTILQVVLPQGTILHEDPDVFGSEIYYYTKRSLPPEGITVVEEGVVK